ncbi:hypothetical protein ACFL6H_06595 [Candidatus Latescibacterota bacterium]
MTYKKIKKWVLISEIIGFGFIILLLWADEIIDIPHHLFGAPVTPINWIEGIIETICISILSIIIIAITSKIMKKIKYLEGFLPVCSNCKKIRIKDEWIPIEIYINDHSEAEFSHGFCPECFKKFISESKEDEQ